MATVDKDFKVKNGLVVGDGGTFGGTVSVATPTSDSHATTKIYVDDLVSGVGGGSISVGDTAPTGASEGDLWYNSLSGSTFVFYDSFWVQVNAAVAGPPGMVIAVSPLSFDAETETLTIDLSAYATLIDLATKIDSTEKGAAGGVATLDATGNVPAAQLNNVDALPDQTGHTGQFLTTDGSTASWTDVDLQAAVTSANTYTDDAIAALVDTAPDKLDTLNELAAALNDDENFATTVTNSLNAKADRVVSFNQQTASYQLVITDADKMVELDNASAITLTVPEDATTNFSVGTTISILQTGAGQVTVAPENANVTVNATPSLLLRTQWSSATLVKRAANTWYLAGDLE